MNKKKFPPVSQELLIPCDVDSTLIFDAASDDVEAIQMNYYGKEKWCRPSHKHIEFLHSLRERGYYIIVWSGNGKQWADEVVDKLGIRSLISQTMMKPLKYIDDLDCKEWMGTQIYLEEEN